MNEPLASPAGVCVPAPVLAVINGTVTTTSTDVAAFFGKNHRDVLRAIEILLSQLPEEHQRNFAQMLLDVEIGNGATRKDPAYRLTRDGFFLLAMGFTGKRAPAFKLAYIDAFNKLEAELLARPTPAAAIPPPPVDPAEYALNILRQERFLLFFDDEVQPLLRRIAASAYVSSPADWAEIIRDRYVPLNTLTSIIEACVERLATHAQCRAATTKYVEELGAQIAKERRG